jgi:putative spermidine/putrescine transport system permease protein
MNTPTLSPPRASVAPRDAKAWLVAPALIFIAALFIYPFAYGLMLSFKPMNGGGLWANYLTFFTDTSMWPTILVTLKLAVPATACRFPWRSRCAAIRLIRSSSRRCW